LRYYVCSDIHGFCTPFVNSITEAGFFSDPEPHILVILGDLFDRGNQAALLQDYLLDLWRRKLVIFIKGNHEDLYESFAAADDKIPYRYYDINRTLDTATQLTGVSKEQALDNIYSLMSRAMQTPLFTEIIPEMRDYLETEHFIFTHGWIPCIKEGVNRFSYLYDWRNADKSTWKSARWINGIEAARTVREIGKTIVCGHWHCSYGHYRYGNGKAEIGDNADYSPFYSEGIIAIDACTSRSGICNCIVIDD